MLLELEKERFLHLHHPNRWLYAQLGEKKAAYNFNVHVCPVGPYKCRVLVSHGVERVQVRTNADMLCDRWVNINKFERFEEVCRRRVY